MFDQRSRYAAQPTAVHVDDQGRARVFVELREVPAPARPLAHDRRHLVTDNDRVDGIAWEQLGDPEQFWRLADANGALHPDELTAVVGRRLLVPYEGRSGDDQRGSAAR